MTDEEDLDRVRTVLDYMPADLYDEVPDQDREKLASLDRRLNRTVAIKKTEKVDVVVERSTEDVEEKVRQLVQQDDAESERKRPDDVVLTPVEPDTGDEEDVDETPPDPAPTTGKVQELVLDEPPTLSDTTPDEPVETEEWPDPDDRYEEQYGAETESADEDETPPWPETGETSTGGDTEPVPAWPDVGEDAQDAEDGEEPQGFREVSPDDAADGESDDAAAWPDVGGDEPADDATAWPDLDDESDASADEEPGDDDGFREVGPDDEEDGDDATAWPDLDDEET